MGEVVTTVVTTVITIVVTTVITTVITTEEDTNVIMEDKIMIIDNKIIIKANKETIIHVIIIKLPDIKKMKIMEIKVEVDNNMVEDKIEEVIIEILTITDEEVVEDEE